MSKPTLLVTGGAGYIGSHTVKLLENTCDVIVLDNLVYGHAAALSSNVTLVKGDTGDKELVKKIVTDYTIEAVLHFAAYAYVGESVTSPAK